MEGTTTLQVNEGSKWKAMDGEISGKLRRDKYDESQLLLAVDTVVDELIGEKPKDLPEVVLRSEYEDILLQLNACLARPDLRRQLADAQSKISELQAEIDGLKARLDSSELRIAVAENSARGALISLHKHHLTYNKLYRNQLQKLLKEYHLKLK